MKNEYAKLPWSVEDTIENLKEIKEHLKSIAKRTNLHGKGEEDAKEIDFDFDRAIEALEKQINPIKFINACNCIYDESILFKAIDLECKNRNCYRQDEYKIYLFDEYPCISIGHNKIRIHNLIGKLLYGNIRKGYVIHHKDHNKLNALPSNLEYLSAKAHTKLHMTGIDHRTEEGKQRSISSAREKTYKKEITKEEIEEMLSQGKTKTEIARHFQCGVNTIYRRLGYKC